MQLGFLHHAPFHYHSCQLVALCVPSIFLSDVLECFEHRAFEREIRGDLGPANYSAPYSTSIGAIKFVRRDTPVPRARAGESRGLAAPTNRVRAESRYGSSGKAQNGSMAPCCAFERALLGPPLVDLTSPRYRYRGTEPHRPSAVQKLESESSCHVKQILPSDHTQRQGVPALPCPAALNIDARQAICNV